MSWNDAKKKYGDKAKFWKWKAVNCPIQFFWRWIGYIDKADIEKYS
jgi:hypothetical protein